MRSLMPIAAAQVNSSCTKWKKENVSEWNNNGTERNEAEKNIARLMWPGALIN